MTKGYKDLTVWNKSIDLVKKIYKLTKIFPNEEKFGLSNQMRRASVSIPSNIAEGSSRNTNKGFKQFIYIAKGSLCELETQIIISKELNYVEKNNFDKLLTKCNEIGKMLTGLIKSLN